MYYFLNHKKFWDLSLCREWDFITESERAFIITFNLFKCVMNKLCIYKQELEQLHIYWRLK